MSTDRPMGMRSPRIAFANPVFGPGSIRSSGEAAAILMVTPLGDRFVARLRTAPKYDR